MNLKLTSKAQEEALPIPTDVILASQSIGRNQILEKLGIRYKTIVTHVDEDKLTGRDPLATMRLRAKTKLDEVLNKPRVFLLNEKYNNLVIAADSSAVIGKKIFGKAQERSDVTNILKHLMGRIHTFATAVAIGYMEPEFKVTRRWEKLVMTKVTMRKMNKAELESYVNRYDFSRYAGGYALNECPWDLVTKIDGSYTNVVGLPLETILPILRSLEIIA